MNRETIQGLAKASLLDAETIPVLCDALEEIGKPFFDSLMKHLRLKHDPHFGCKCSYPYIGPCPILTWLGHDMAWDFNSIHPTRVPPPTFEQIHGGFQHR